MFQAALSQVTVFRKIIESLKDLVSEVNLDATAEGLSLQAMDSAHVSLVALKINEGAFEDYRCDKPLTLGINLSDFSKILKMAKNDDLMILSSDENTSSLSIVFDNKKNEKKAEFNLNLLTLDTQSLGIPDTEYPSYIKLSSADFVSLCRDFTQLSNTVKITVSDETAVFSIDGKAGAGKITMKNNEAEKVEDQVTVVSGKKVSCSFGLQYLNSFAKASALSNIVTLNLSPEFPLMIEYEIKDVGYVKFYLAPKMEDEEEQ